MGKVFVTESHLQDIADAIRDKNGSSDTYKPSEMAQAIADISGGGGAYDWIAAGAEHVTKLVDLTMDLNETGFAAWTPSTSTKTTLASQSKYATYSADCSTYVYFILQRVITDVKYASGTTMKSAIVKNVRLVLYSTIVNPANLAQLKGKNAFTASGGNISTLLNLSYTDYFNSNGTESGTTTTNYAPAMCNPSTPTITNAPASATISFTRPAISARCNDTQFSTASAAAVNSDASSWRWIVDIFRVPKPSLGYSGWYAVSDILNDTIEEY